VTAITSPRRRKARDPTLADNLVVLRAAAQDPTRTLRNLVLDASGSGRTYAVERSDGRREILYGISVYAQCEGQEVENVLRRFAQAPRYAAFSVGEIGAAGFEVIPTGTNPDHYDVQLIGDRFEGEPAEATDEELRAAAVRLLSTARQVASNPAYADSSEDE
jgi:hypothetical protein